MTCSRYGNCITELVTEMPRCCSRRIQSEVAWRAALRPLTVPAMVIAPPNSSSFSVSVVLPASGCEMMANVRRRAISCSSVLMGRTGQRRTKRASLIDGALEHDGVFAPPDGLVVPAAHADLAEAERLIEADGGQIRGPGLEIRLERA